MSILGNDHVILSDLRVKGPCVHTAWIHHVGPALKGWEGGRRGEGGGDDKLGEGQPGTRDA